MLRVESMLNPLVSNQRLRVDCNPLALLLDQVRSRSQLHRFVVAGLRKEFVCCMASTIGKAYVVSTVGIVFRNQFQVRPFTD